MRGDIVQLVSSVAASAAFLKKRDHSRTVMTIILQEAPRLTRSISKALSVMSQTFLPQDISTLAATLSIASEPQNAPAMLADLLETHTASDCHGLLQLIRSCLEAVPSLVAFTAYSNQDWRSHEDLAPWFCILRPLWGLVGEIHHEVSQLLGVTDHLCKSHQTYLLKTLAVFFWTCHKLLD